MTDAEIIRAFECCEANEGGNPNCKECPYFSLAEKPSNCYIMARKQALDLINRQKAEIERLTINMNAFGLGMKREKERADNAIKEFAERLKERSFSISIFLFDSINEPCIEAVKVNDIDNLVNEMAGDTE